MQAPKIDAFEFCRQKERRDGRFKLADMSRLAAECTDAEGELQWQLAGATNQFGHPTIEMQVSGEVRLRCQRCMQALPFTIGSKSVLVLGRSEQEADDIEALLDDEAVDVIVGEHSMSVLDLIEDEALLALPPSPRHEQCPDGDVAEVEKQQSKVSPFAVLKKLQ